MWGVCNTPLPYRQERQGTKAEKNELTSHPFIFTSNHYGNSVRMYREVGVYCIRPLKCPAWGV